MPPPDEPDATFAALARRLRRRWQRLYLVLSHRYAGDDAERLGRLAELARDTGLRPLATNDVHYHHPDRRPLQDVVTCIREHAADRARPAPVLFANAERHLKPPGRDGAAVRRLPAGAARARLEIAEALPVLARRARLRLPDPGAATTGRTPRPGAGTARLGRCRASATPTICRRRSRRSSRHELALIAQLRYAPYFLTVHDIVALRPQPGHPLPGPRLGRQLGGLLRARASPRSTRRASDLLFERFVSAERDEPPDIDVDFEHERREEVIQYIYETLRPRPRGAGRHASIRYRASGAMREVGKVMGLSGRRAGRAQPHRLGLAATSGLTSRALREAGLDPDDPTLRRTLELAQRADGLPAPPLPARRRLRHRQGPLDELVPIENAAMEDRTVVEWDKDDLDALRHAQGRRAGARHADLHPQGASSLLRAHYGVGLDARPRVPAEDPAVYEMLCRADSIGVFQVESRAQMSMLPRLQAAQLLRPGHRGRDRPPGADPGRHGAPLPAPPRGRASPSTFPSEELRRRCWARPWACRCSRSRRCRSPSSAAGFTPGEADGLRRAMAAFRQLGHVERYRREARRRAWRRAATPREFAERCFSQIEGFGDYGFPESHAASFALLVYVSAWLKCHYPDVFCARAAQQPADGLLRPGPAGARRPRPRRRGARGRRQRSATGTARWSRAAPRAAHDRRPPRPAPDQGLASRTPAARRGPRASRYRTLEELRAAPGTAAARPWCCWPRPTPSARSGLDRRQALWAVQALKDPAPAAVRARRGRARPAPTCRPSRAATSPGSSCRRWAWASR